MTTKITTAGTVFNPRPPVERLAEEKKLKRCICVSLEPRPRQVEKITILPYRQFLDALWDGGLSG